MPRKRIPYNKPVTPSYVLELRSKAKLGDNSALEELKKRNYYLARKANSALSKLEKSGYTRWSYNRATSYTESEFGMNRFTTSSKKLPDIVDLQVNILEMSKFLKSKASTVEGNIEIDNKIVDKFREKGIAIRDDEVSDFLDLITSDDFQTLKRNYVDSGTIILDMADITNDNKVSISDIKKAFSKVVNNDVTYDIALEELGYKI